MNLVDKWEGVFTFSGIGAFLGFLVAILLYTPLQRGWMVYLIYIGAVAGALLGVKYDFHGRASAFSFILGIATALFLIIAVVSGKMGVWAVYVAMGATMGILLLILPDGVVDVFLVPFVYLGAFTIVILLFTNYPPIHDNRYAVPFLFSMAGKATVLAFFASLSRWGFELARRLPRLKRGNV